MVLRSASTLDAFRTLVTAQGTAVGVAEDESIKLRAPCACHPVAHLLPASYCRGNGITLPLLQPASRPTRVSYSIVSYSVVQASSTRVRQEGEGKLQGTENNIRGKLDRGCAEPAFSIFECWIWRRPWSGMPPRRSRRRQEEGRGRQECVDVVLVDCAASARRLDVLHPPPPFRKVGSRGARGAVRLTVVHRGPRSGLL
eukprot:scaffold3303_cov66-Phaeocystis_antarctica.AAC.4